MIKHHTFVISHHTFMISHYTYMISHHTSMKMPPHVRRIQESRNLQDAKCANVPSLHFSIFWAFQNPWWLKSLKSQTKVIPKTHFNYTLYKKGPRKQHGKDGTKVDLVISVVVLTGMGWSHKREEGTVSQELASSCVPFSYHDCIFTDFCSSEGILFLLIC